MKYAMAALAAALVTAAPAHSQQYPIKPVRVIVPFAPGGGSDITARQFSAKLSEYLGQQFVVDNRAGAGGLIGFEVTARAPADGYTIMMVSARRTTLPDVPTIADTLPGYDVVLWFGAMAPRNTPPAIVGALNAGINKALQDPAIKRNLEGDGMMPSGGTPQQFQQRIRADYERWNKVVKETGVKAE